MSEWSLMGSNSIPDYELYPNVTERLNKRREKRQKAFYDLMKINKMPISKVKKNNTTKEE